MMHSMDRLLIFFQDVVLLPPTTKLGKVMFLHLSVILFTGGHMCHARPPAMHSPCHASPLPHMPPPSCTLPCPLPHMPPTTHPLHVPCHACPPLPHMPPAMHAPYHTCPPAMHVTLSCMPPPPPCMPHNDITTCGQ